MSNFTPPTKRQRTSNGTDMNNQRPAPSFVVHARNLSETVTEMDLRDSLDKYGIINRIILMPRKRQALIEFSEIASSISLVNDASRTQIVIAGSPTYFNYSLNQKLVKYGEANDDNDSDETNILLFNVEKPLYPITVDVMNTICLPFGTIHRIVIIRKNGVQAMVEYDNKQSAIKARQALNNADVYSGCCTLKIEYSKLNRLNVFKNDQDTWDYTNEKINQRSNGNSNNNNNNNNNNNSNTNNNRQNGSNVSNNSNGKTNNYNNNNSNNSNNNPKNTSIPSLMSNSSSSQSQPKTKPNDNELILMINNLCTTKFNCDRLFNLLCLYGNVDRIKFLITKEGSAMALMNASESILGYLQYINNVYIFGRKIHIHVSNQNELKPALKPAALPDGTPSYKDFTNCRNNRYSTNETASKNKPVAPANVLHWFNAPPDFTEQEVIDIFLSAGAKPPTKVKVFQKKSDKSTTGLAEWNNIAECTEALILTNHTDIDHPSSKYPYTFKLCFSATPILDSNSANGSSGGGNHQSNNNN